MDSQVTECFQKNSVTGRPLIFSHNMWPGQVQSQARAHGMLIPQNVKDLILANYTGSWYPTLITKSKQAIQLPHLSLTTGSAASHHRDTSFIIALIMLFNCQVGQISCKSPVNTCNCFTCLKWDSTYASMYASSALERACLFQPVELLSLEKLTPVPREIVAPSTLKNPYSPAELQEESLLYHWPISQ